MYLQEALKQADLKQSTIEIFGLGYVGLPLSIRLATAGYKVIGIDNDLKKISRLRENVLIGSELLLKDEFQECRKKGSLVFAQKSANTSNLKICIICVPTPIPKDNIASDMYVVSAIQNFLETAKQGDVIIIESSIEIGTTDKMKHLIESRKFVVGKDFGLCFCPERIDPLNKKWNLENIPRVIFCYDDSTFQIASIVYKHVNNSNLVRVSSAKIAEVVKSFENAFRLVNISLVNELAILCDELEISAKEVLDAAATKPFGFMVFYPGAGAGGHCIPKDPIFLLESAKKHGISFNTIKSALNTNMSLPSYISASIENTLNEMRLPKSVIVCGLSYKPNVEDMRDSPGFKIVQEFVSKGFRVATYEPHYIKELEERYLKENNMTSLEFKNLNSLDDEILKEYNCLCIVQHHLKTKFRINEIYNKSLVPFIYDCQSQIKPLDGSKTILKRFGM